MSNDKVKKQVLDAFGFRHACKIFDADKKISDDDFDFLLKTVQLSPSSFGFEPWHVIVLQDMCIRAKLIPATWGAQRQLPTCSHYIVLLARKSTDMKYGSEYIEHMIKNVQKVPEDVAEGKRAHYQNFQERDFDIMDDRAMFDWACKQCYIALGNMMSAAAMIGIDSCPVEGFIRKDVEAILAEDGLLDTEKYGIACMAAFGYRIRQQKEKARKPMDEIVTFVE